MAKKNSITRYSTSDSKNMPGKTDWSRVDATTEEEVKRHAAADGVGLPDGWESSVMLGIPSPKQGVYLRLDPDILDWFKMDGAGYQTRINHVLRAFVSARKMADNTRHS